MGVSLPDTAAQAVAALQEVVPKAKLHVYGSQVTGLADAGSDVDVTLEFGASEHSLDQLQQLLWPLANAGFAEMELLHNARVPIAKVIHKATGVAMDVSVNNLLPVYNSQLIKAYVDLDPRLGPVVKQVKRWTKDLGIRAQGPSGSPGLSSYALAIMCIYYAQVVGVLPRLQGKHAPAKWIEGRNCGFAVPADWAPSEKELSFAGFVHFFAEDFDWGVEVVSLRGRKQALHAQLEPLCVRDPLPLHIEDPLELERDLCDVLRDGGHALLRACFLRENAPRYLVQLGQQEGRAGLLHDCALGGKLRAKDTTLVASPDRHLETSVDASHSDKACHPTSPPARAEPLPLHHAAHPCQADLSSDHGLSDALGGMA